MPKTFALLSILCCVGRVRSTLIDLCSQAGAGDATSVHLGGATAQMVQHVIAMDLSDCDADRPALSPEALTSAAETLTLALSQLVGVPATALSTGVIQPDNVTDPTRLRVTWDIAMAPDGLAHICPRLVQPPALPSELACRTGSAPRLLSQAPSDAAPRSSYSILEGTAPAVARSESADSPTQLESQALPADAATVAAGPVAATDGAADEAFDVGADAELRYAAARAQVAEEALADFEASDSAGEPAADARSDADSAAAAELAVVAQDAQLHDFGAAEVQAAPGAGDAGSVDQSAFVGELPGERAASAYADAAPGDHPSLSRTSIRSWSASSQEYSNPARGNYNTAAGGGDRVDLTIVYAHLSRLRSAPQRWLHAIVSSFIVLSVFFVGVMSGVILARDSWPSAPPSSPAAPRTWRWRHATGSPHAVQCVSLHSSSKRGAGSSGWLGHRPAITFASESGDAIKVPLIEQRS